MNQGPLVFLGIFVTLVTSWFGMIFVPQAQVGNLQPVKAEVSGGLYPAAKSGMAQQGAEVYRQQGCYYCHSQQIRQSGVHFDVILIKAGSNTNDLIKAIAKHNGQFGEAALRKLIQGTPVEVLSGVTLEEAEKLNNEIGAIKVTDDSNPQSTYRAVAQGADFDREWGARRTVAPDYLFERTPMLGELRVGPDLTNIGSRQTNAVWHLTHLYNPKLVAEGSKMPPYKFLFEKRKKGHVASPDALTLPDIEPDMEVVPTQDSKVLVAYLLSLKTTTPIFETPMPPVIKKEQPATNDTAKAATAP
ncbi:MAG TPA: cbb3-type cytochrome c oxidase subunit II [Verrucomicrobiae bacterium]